MNRQREADLSDEELALVVTKLTQISRETHLDHAIRVGSLVIHYFYGGDVRFWRARGPKTTSFRRLARHPELPMSASVLCRCVAVYDLCQRLDLVSRWTRITLSHIRIVLRLDETAQCQLLSSANAQRWTVEQLEAEARKYDRRASGRRPKPELVRKADAIGRLNRVLAKLLEESSETEGETVVDGRLVEVNANIAAALQGLERARALLLGVSRREPDDGLHVDAGHSAPAFALGPSVA